MADLTRTQGQALPANVLVKWVDQGSNVYALLHSVDGSTVSLADSTEVVMVRDNSVVDITIANGASESEEVDMTGKAGGSVFVPSAWTDANIGFKKATTSGGTFVLARDDTGALIQITNVQTAEVDSYQIPDALFGSRYVKVCSHNAIGEAVNQGGDRAMSVELSS